MVRVDVSQDLVLVDVDSAHGVATITLNRPEARNALSGAVIEQLRAAYDLTLDRDDVGAVVLTGADPSFCAGMDLRELGSSAATLSVDFFSRLWQTSTPVIAAVNGAAVTGGLELVLACDMVVASEKARFADTHARVGLMPGAGMSVLLPQAVGVRLAKEMSLTGRFVDAHEAHTAGLVNRVVPHGELLEAAVGLAREIASGDRRVVFGMNALISANSRLTVADALANETNAFVAFLRGELDPANVEARREEVIRRGSDLAGGGRD